MKLLNFGDNAATIGGKHVPYSLLGALAAILGAFLIWKFNQNGGLQLGQQSPDLADLGGGGGVDLSGLSDSLTPSVPTIPVYGLGYPAPLVGPAYAMDTGSGGAAFLGYSKVIDVFYAPSGGPSSGGSGVGLDPGTSYVPPKIIASPKPSSGGVDTGFTAGTYTAPTKKTTTTTVGTIGGGSFAA